MTDILERPQPSSDRRVNYGSDPTQFAELRYPRIPGSFPLLFVIHGGFWRHEYDLSHMGHLCAALTRKGVVTCNIEYRRLGDDGGGWPGTFQDISLACDRLLQSLSTDPRIDTKRVSVSGFSAGGHLALWVASRHRIPESSRLLSHPANRINGAISLAGVCDLREAWKQQLGGGVVDQLLGSPDTHPQRYLEGSPIELLPTNTSQTLVHGTNDPIVPISQSEFYADKAARLGDHPQLVRLEGIGHFELIDPESGTWPQVEQALLRQLIQDR